MPLEQKNQYLSPSAGKDNIPRYPFSKSSLKATNIFFLGSHLRLKESKFFCDSVMVQHVDDLLICSDNEECSSKTSQLFVLSPRRKGTFINFEKINVISSRSSLLFKS